MYKCSLCLREIKLMVQAGPDLSHGMVLLSMYTLCCSLARSPPGMTIGDLVVDAHFKSSWATSTHWVVHFILMLVKAVWTLARPAHPTPIPHAANHVLAVARVILGHLTGWFEAGIGDLGRRQLLNIGLS